MSDLSHFNGTEFLRIWFNTECKEEFYETTRLELRDTNTVVPDKWKFYNSIIKNKGKSLKKYKFKNKSISTSFSDIPYIEKIGLLLMNFLNTDFSDFDNAFDNFYSLYGIDFIYDYSVYEIFNDIFKTEQDAYDTLKVLHNRGRENLIKIQNKYRKATDFIFNLDNNEEYKKYSIKSSFSACLVSNKFDLKDYSSKIKTETKVNNYNYDGSYELPFDTIVD